MTFPTNTGFAGVPIPQIGPQGMGANMMVYPQGYDPRAQQPAAQPTSFTEFMGGQPAAQHAQAGGQASTQPDFNQVLNLFNSMVSGAQPQGQTAAPASPASPATAGTQGAAPAAPALAPYEAMLKDFSPEFGEPAYLSAETGLPAILANRLANIDFAAGLGSADPNAFMRSTMQSLLTTAAQAAFIAAQDAYKASTPNAFKEFARRNYEQQQMQSVQKLEGIPDGLQVFAQSAAKMITSAQPNATPDQVRQGVVAVMSAMKQAFMPAPVAQPNAQPMQDWAAMFNSN